jgi:hypothetical protein
MSEVNNWSSEHPRYRNPRGAAEACAQRRCGDGTLRPGPGGDSRDFRRRSEIEPASAGSFAGAAWVTANSFTHVDEAAFGAGANETPLTEQSQAI